MSKDPTVAGDHLPTGGIVTNTGPILQASILCERILQEKDETLSIIRMVDRFRVPKGIPEETPLPLNILVAFKSGSYTGTFDLRIRLCRPSGAINDLAGRYPATFRGAGTDGVNLLIGIPVALRERGLHRFDILREDEILAAILFTIEEAPPSPTPSPEEQKGAPEAERPSA